MFLAIEGMSVKNPMFTTPPHPFYSVYAQDLATVMGMTIPATIRGNELTNTLLGYLRIPWGEETTLNYSALQEGWTYTWDVDQKTFAVTDANNAITLYRDIGSISALGVSWDVLTSAQFLIKTPAYLQWSVFLIAAKQDKKQNCKLVSYAWGEADHYLVTLFHAVYSFLVGWPTGVGGDAGLTQDDYSGIAVLSDCLLAKAKELVTAGGYPNNLQSGNRGICGSKAAVKRQSLLAMIESTLMIRLFAAKLLNGSDAVFEPWLLYKLFQWLGQAQPSESADKIFDLSPWWG